MLIFVSCLLYYYVHKINNLLMFKPEKSDKSHIIGHTKEGDIEIIKNNLYIDTRKICFTYIKNNNSKLTFLYSHGNSGNIMDIENSYSTKFLLTYGSVMIYDYRGYGKSTGSPSDGNIKDDTLAIWNYLIYNCDIKPENIVLYGFSMGTSCALWLGHHLSKNSKSMPKAIIIQSGYYNIKRLVCELYSLFLVSLTVLKFDNNEYIKYIKKYNGNYPVYILHSKNDGLINFDHAIDLSKENNCPLLEISGTHDDYVLTQNIRELINGIKIY